MPLLNFDLYYLNKIGHNAAPWGAPTTVRSDSIVDDDNTPTKWQSSMLQVYNSIDENLSVNNERIASTGGELKRTFDGKTNHCILEIRGRIAAKNHPEYEMRICLGSSLTLDSYSHTILLVSVGEGLCISPCILSSVNNLIDL